MFSRKRRVRYHLFDGNGGLDAPNQGIETGTDWRNHYVGFKASTSTGTAGVPLEGDGQYEIAREGFTGRC